MQTKTKAPVPAVVDLRLEEMLSEDRASTEYEIACFTGTVSDDLWSLMESRNLSQAEFAERAGVAKQFLTKIFRGGNCTLETVAKLSLALGYRPQIDYLPLTTSQWVDWIPQESPRTACLELWNKNEFRPFGKEAKANITL